MRTNLKIKKYPKKYWLIPIVTFAAAVLIQLFLQDYLYNFSIDYIVKTQTELNKIFNVKKEEAYKPRDIIFWVFYVLTSNYFYLVFVALIYNFVNVYKAFVLALSIYIGNLLSATMGLIYHAPRPFMVNYNIMSYIKDGEWGQPSPQIIVAVSFYCTLWKVISKHRPLKGKVCIKLTIAIIFIIYCMAVILIHFASGLVTFDQIIVSVLLGISVYSAMFFIFKVKVNNAAQFYDIIKTRFIYFFVLNLILILFLVILYRYINYEEDKEYFGAHLKVQFDKFDMNYVDDNFFNSFTLSEGTFTNALCFISNIIAIIALKMEMIITYDKDFDSWKKENFDDKALHQSVNFSIFTEYKYSTSTQWNHTSFIKVFIRCLFCLVLSIAPVLLFLIPLQHIPNIVKFIIFSFAPHCYYAFGIFYLFKKIYMMFGLNNRIISVSSLESD
ncbi:MAG: hypothetical protein MJ252_09650 [archaeon]|nr:hypothetical protein [archaeon]